MGALALVLVCSLVSGALVTGPSAKAVQAGEPVSRIYTFDNALEGPASFDTTGGYAPTGNPGAPWNIVASAVPGGGKLLLTQVDGTVSVANSDGSGVLGPVVPRSVNAFELNPDMSLDGSGTRIAYVGADQDVHYADLDGQNDRNLGRGTDTEGAINPVVSPDGQWVAFDSHHPADGRRGIQVIPTDGSGQSRLIVPQGEGADGARWFPDSRRLAFVDIVPCALEGNVACVDVAVGDITTLEVQQLGVGYYIPDESEANRHLNLSRSFSVHAIAVSPDGRQLAVEGRFNECSYATHSVEGQNGETTPQCGESTASSFHQSQLGVVPAPGGAFSPVLKRPGRCGYNGDGCVDPTGGTLADPADFEGDASVPLWWGGPTYKLVFFTNTTQANGFDYHSFVGFRGPGAFDNSTVGKYPAFNLLSDKGYIGDERGTHWTYRLSHIVTREQFDAARTFVASQQQAANGNAFPFYVRYSWLDANCTDWIRSVALAANVTLPDFRDVHPPILGILGQVLYLQDPLAMERVLSGANNGAPIPPEGVPFAGGTVYRNTGNSPAGLAGIASDPPTPIDVSAAAVAQHAIANPSDVATELSMRYTTSSLGDVAVGQGATVSIEQLTPDGIVTITGIDWGDGSPPELFAQPSSQPVSTWTHRYDTSGNFTDTIVVIEDGGIAAFSGSVVVNLGPTSATQTAAVPPPGPTVAYPKGPIAPDVLPPITTTTSTSTTVSTTTTTTVVGARIPPPPDFDGDGDTDRSVYRDGAWFAEGQATRFLGLAGDIPVPGDYDGDGDDDRAVYRAGAWYVDGQPPACFGNATDIPVPGDYDGDGDADRAVYRPSVGGWYVEGVGPEFFGLDGDIPVPGDYDGNGTTDRAVWRPDVGGWYVHDQAFVSLGLGGDVPVPGDYDGNGTTDRAVWRPDVGAWFVHDQATVFLGLDGDVPVPGDYDGGGATDRAVWRPSVGGWFVQDQVTAFLGLDADIPLPLPHAIYRFFF
jgi:hypothetical protein